MKKIIVSSVLAASLLVGADYNYEVTPIIGYVDTKDHGNLDNHAVAGISVSRIMGDDCKFDKLELGLLQSGNTDYENSSMDTKLTQIFFNGVKEYKLNDGFKLYALAGLGYEKISDEQFNNDSGTYANYGVGAGYTFSNNLSLKLDARHQFKFDGDRSIVYTLGLGIPFGQKAVKQAEVKEEIVEPKVVEPVVLDSDKDGVVDSLDKCPTTSAGVAVDADGCEVLAVPADLGIVFETNSDKIKNSDITKFDKYAKYLKDIPTAKVIVEAHTDSVGNDKYNLQLSQRRAQSAKNQLISMGVDASRIEAIGYGETKPIVANDTAENKAKNRRVTARIEK